MAAGPTPLLHVFRMTVSTLSLCGESALNDRSNVFKIILSLKRLPKKITLFLREVVYDGDKLLKVVSVHVPPR